MTFLDKLLGKPPVVHFERRGVKWSGELAKALLRHPNVEVTAACLDSEFRIDCLQYSPAVGNEPPRLRIRIEPDGEL